MVWRVDDGECRSERTYYVVAWVDSSHPPLSAPLLSCQRRPTLSVTSKRQHVYENVKQSTITY